MFLFLSNTGRLDITQEEHSGKIVVSMSYFVILMKILQFLLEPLLKS